MNTILVVYNAVNDYVADCFQELENQIKSEVYFIVLHLMFKPSDWVPLYLAIIWFSYIIIIIYNNPRSCETVQYAKTT